jgi:transcriptional regulator with XRE-family HTH domain
MIRANGIGTTLKKWRQRLGKSQMDIAVEVGSEPSTVSRWENDNSRPRTSRCGDLAKAYGVSRDTMAQLLGG